MIARLCLGLKNVVNCIVGQILDMNPPIFIGDILRSKALQHFFIQMIYRPTSLIQFFRCKHPEMDSGKRGVRLCIHL